jgi:hypothetical protein
MTAAHRRLAATLTVGFKGHSRLMGGDEAVATRRFAKDCEAQDVPDTLVLRCLAKTHR